MRAAILILISFAVTSVAGAEPLRLPPSDQQQPQSGKTLPLKGSTARANSCAAYGQGFMMVNGTCVKIGGAISAGSRRRP